MNKKRSAIIEGVHATRDLWLDAYGEFTKEMKTAPVIAKCSCFVGGIIAAPFVATASLGFGLAVADSVARENKEENQL